MKRFIDVHTGEIMAGQGEVILKSDTGSACLIIAAYDPAHKIGALAHAMFANSPVRHESPVLRDAAHAIDEMVADMELLGSRPDTIEISLVAGENVRADHSNSAYRTNIDEVLGALKARRIRFRSDLLEDVGNAHVTLDVESGKISCE